ncbi:hypothetical protein PV02_01735 [Methanolobus chelungpuianus]|uniref:Uncharacterized protein n=1 Tax=Methanolobus chelungpuianus TaxID=502115 RepID=A0AAE3H934_9EURY|nr:hypothetical protein [Methanolobus chelungpuianus]
MKEREAGLNQSPMDFRETFFFMYGIENRKFSTKNKYIYIHVDLQFPIRGESSHIYRFLFRCYKTV